MKYTFSVFIFLLFSMAFAQQDYWQQHVDYTIEIELNTKNHTFNGKQELVYTNNSPDTLTQVFYHLYFNAFQPGSMMDVRSEVIPDPDKRIAGNIAKLKQDEIGFQKVTMLTQNGKALRYDVVGTVLQAELIEPLLPGAKAAFNMLFNGQVPVQIRRSGRNNKEDIDYTMTQWYPKLAEYDRDGWHPDQYIAREFFAPFGNFDVKITLPSEYVIGGTGVLQNPREIGHGYGKKVAHTSEMLTWHFKAENVHDFAWAADPDFLHDSFKLQDGTDIHLLYHKETANIKNWQKAKPEIEKFFLFMNAKFGQYAYPQFSLVQGGDGGMEYPMCTMVLGSGKSYKGFIGLFAHEAAHSWYHGMLASNEQRYAWLDEGFTTFAEEEAMNFMFDEGKTNPHLGGFGTYMILDSLGVLEPMTTPSDHFSYNALYTTGSYYMGELYLMQLQYVIGEEAFWRGMKMYYNRWLFKHPNPDDFIKTMEDASALQLDWLEMYWTKLTKSSDYAIEKVESSGPTGTLVTLRNLGQRPMPVDVMVSMKDGTQTYYTIPLVSMYGYKDEAPYSNQQPWPWTNPTYILSIPAQLKSIDSITLDPYQRSCDVKTRNNHWIAAD